MGRIGDDDIRRVREATDAVSLISERVVLKQKGRLFWGCCPFHNEKTPSFKVDPGSQLWHCFGCGKGGDAFGFLMEAESMLFPDAIRYLADRANIELVEEGGPGLSRGHKERLIAVSEETAEYYHTCLTRLPGSDAANARTYLSKRGFGSEVSKRWTLGYAPGRGALCAHLTSKGFTAAEIIDANVGLKSDGGVLRDRFYERVMFPIADLQGRTIAFGGRVVGAGEPKYLNTQETPIFHKSSNMFAIDRAKATIVSTGIALVAEGYTDVIALHEAGITNVVATLGTALTEQHVKLLSRFARKIIYVFDGDEAGKRAADRASEFIDSSLTPESGRTRTELFVAVLPAGKDPADIISEQGADAFSAYIDAAVPLLRFSIDRRLDRWDLDRPEERASALRDAAEVLFPVKGSILADDYANYIADRLLADFTTVRKAIEEARPQNARPTSRDEHAAAVTGAGEEHDSPELKLERELLSLVTTRPELLRDAAQALDGVPWSSPRHRQLAGILIGATPTTSAAEIVARAEAALPGSAAVLSGGTLEAGGDMDLGETLGFLKKSLVEADLEKKIMAGNARLRTSGSLTPVEFDELFREVVEIQKELAGLRKKRG